MQAASANLTPVTLELGGKSPAIIGADYPIEKAALKIAAGKLFNAGQTCIAPDYVFVPEHQKNQFITAFKAAVKKLYPGSFIHNPDYTCIISDNHFNRLNELLHESTSNRNHAISLSDEYSDSDNRKFIPHLIDNPAASSRLLKEEIFGPLLPILTYQNLNEVINYINDKDPPLALYYFGHNQNNIDALLKQTLSGGVTINDTILHVAQDDLPFGGVRTSGIGHYHGKEGFDTFSKKKSVFKPSRFSTFPLLYPPANWFSQKLIAWLIKHV